MVPTAGCRLAAAPPAPTEVATTSFVSTRLSRCHLPLETPSAAAGLTAEHMVLTPRDQQAVPFVSVSVPAQLKPSQSQALRKEQESGLPERLLRPARVAAPRCVAGEPGGHGVSASQPGGTTVRIQVQRQRIEASQAARGTRLSDSAAGCCGRRLSGSPPPQTSSTRRPWPPVRSPEQSKVKPTQGTLRRLSPDQGSTNASNGSTAAASCRVLNNAASPQCSATPTQPQAAHGGANSAACLAARRVTPTLRTPLATPSTVTKVSATATASASSSSSSSSSSCSRPVLSASSERSSGSLLRPVVRTTPNGNAGATSFSVTAAAAPSTARSQGSAGSGATSSRRTRRATGCASQWRAQHLGATAHPANERK
eukprot:TRINITY_DN8659_c0_g1_i5.p1 TRINITY_DN8659_c0_g1~~TRINITY_DN8659_c0_g1_i5.p1  ORF type:complete len:369 (+),score=34.40 TRINITY_DN8659_c0_g1_i5:120-1226(+)